MYSITLRNTQGAETGVTVKSLSAVKDYLRKYDLEGFAVAVVRIDRRPPFGEREHIGSKGHEGKRMRWI